MKPAGMIGTASGCFIWLLLMLIVGPIFFGLALLAGGFTNLTDVAKQVTTPLVCPKGTTARVDVTPSTYVDSNGFESPSVANNFNCVDASGNVVAERTHEQQYLWNTIVVVIGLVLAGVVSFLFAAPFGALIGWVLGKFRGSPA